MTHRYSGWPGAWCLDCGQEDPMEVALACRDCHVKSYPGDEPDRLCPEHSVAVARECPTPNSNRYNPYRSVDAK